MPAAVHWPTRPTYERAPCYICCWSSAKNALKGSDLRIEIEMTVSVPTYHLNCDRPCLGYDVRRTHTLFPYHRPHKPGLLLPYPFRPVHRGDIALFRGLWITIINLYMVFDVVFVTKWHHQLDPKIKPFWLWEYFLLGFV